MIAVIGWNDETNMGRNALILGNLLVHPFSCNCLLLVVVVVTNCRIDFLLEGTSPCVDAVVVKRWNVNDDRRPCRLVVVESRLFLSRRGVVVVVGGRKVAAASTQQDMIQQVIPNKSILATGGKRVPIQTGINLKSTEGVHRQGQDAQSQPSYHQRCL